MKLKIYIDVFGRIGICELFPDDESHAELNEMLRELADEDFYGDTYRELTPGFYIAEFDIDDDGDGEAFLQINNVSNI